MKVLALNGSPRENGNTSTVLQLMGREIEAEGVEFETLRLGGKDIRGCVACDHCIFSETHRCVMADGEFSGWLDQMEAADGLIFAAPTYFGNIPGNFKCFLDRAFCGHGYPTRNKVASVVTVARRGGASMAYSQLLNYIVTGDMILAPSPHWNVVHGALKGEAEYDPEGIEAARMAAKKMVWLLKSIHKAGIRPPQADGRWLVTNFVRDDLKKQR